MSEITPDGDIEVADTPGRPQPTRPGNFLRNASQSFTQSRLPVGMFHAYGHYASAVPTMDDIQKGNFSKEGWSGPGQRRNSQAHRASDHHILHWYRCRNESKKDVEKVTPDAHSLTAEPSVMEISAHDPSVPYANGYQFPPNHSKWEATLIALKGFGRYVITPVGFVITIYSLNVVGWGGMLFLILCRGTPAMVAQYGYDDDRSSAKKWLEVDSQILNALFCVTGIGLIPWRFRDLYYLLQWRWKENHDGLRKLAGIHRGWFRLQGSQEIDVKYNPEEESVPPGVNEEAMAIPIKLSPGPPLTGERAPSSEYWKMDLVVWAFVVNTLLQIVLCGFMWGMDRYTRPGAVVGLLISLACIIAMVGGWYIFAEGKRVKKVEGIPVSKEDMKILQEMRLKELSDNSSTTV